MAFRTRDCENAFFIQLVNVSDNKQLKVLPPYRELSSRADSESEGCYQIVIRPTGLTPPSPLLCTRGLLPI